MSYIDPSKRLDWLTPKHVMDDWVLPTLGDIDIDPCGNVRSVVPASVHFCGLGERGDGDDGMAAPWHQHGDGKTFFNPTFGERKPKAKEGEPPLPPMPCFYPLSRWMLKVQAEYGQGATIYAVLPAATDRNWFHFYIAQCTAFTLLDPRIQFRLPEHEEGHKSNPGAAHMTALWSHDDGELNRYCERMDRLGMVIEP